MRHLTREIGGWGNFPRERCQLLRAERTAHVAEILREPPAATCIPRGLGRSYGDAALNRDAGVLLLEKMDRFLAWDPATAVLDCEAGASLAAVVRHFLPRGFFPPVTPGTRFVTIGGAIAADVHGKNHHRDGTFGRHLLDLHLMTAAGDILRCSPTQNADAFHATVGGMGLTGVILRARVKLAPVESAWVEVNYTRAPNLDAALDQFAAGDASHRYSVAWIDALATGASLGRSVVMQGDFLPRNRLPDKLRERPLHVRPKRRKRVPAFWPGWALNRISVRAFNTLFYARHADATRIVDAGSFFYPLDAIDHWNRLYGRRGFVQYQALFPRETSRAGHVKLLERLSASRRASFLAVLKSTGEQGPGLLSFPLPGHTLALDLPARADIRAFAAELDRIVLDHGGRLYLAKDACTTPAALRAMYPRLDEFLAVKARLDPRGLFSSSQARRLGLAPPAAEGA